MYQTYLGYNNRKVGPSDNWKRRLIPKTKKQDQGQINSRILPIKGRRIFKTECIVSRLLNIFPKLESHTN